MSPGRPVLDLFASVSARSGAERPARSEPKLGADGLGRVLSRCLRLLGESGRTQRPREDNAPEPVAGDSGEFSELGSALQQVLGEARRAIGCAGAALILLGEEGDGLVWVATSGEAAGGSGPFGGFIQGPRQGLGQLRVALQSAVPTILTDETERSLLWRPFAGTPSGAVLALPLSVSVPGPDGASAAWGLLLFDPPAAVLPRIDDTAVPSDPARTFVEMLVGLLGLAVGGHRMGEALHERTRRIRIEKMPKPAPRPLDQYREFFDATTDGVMVLDASGRAVWLNRAAEQMTGYSAEGLAGHPLAGLLPEGQRDRLKRTVEQVLGQAAGGGTSRGPRSVFDLLLTSTSRETLTLSVSTSSVLAAQGYVVLTFRDVTEKRSLESQLRRAKEFLERLIDSTVDGIIAADIRGRVVLFNQGAARITGYSPDEVINRLPVWALYPGREAKRIMSELRSNDFGGRGRLLQSRREIVGKNGVVIPVALTASIIYEAGGDGEREVATVGILSDLRERLRIEQRLSETEEKLAESERQSLLVELAGTTAHELNQPLTSVMGYAQLLKRRVPNTLHELHGYADVLLSEAERMADIVRKIGRITRYETKQYVGTSRILDLDKSSPEVPAISLSEISAPVTVSSPALPRPQHEDGPLFARPRSKPQSGPQAGHKAPPPIPKSGPKSGPPQSGPSKTGPRGRS